MVLMLLEFRVFKSSVSSRGKTCPDPIHSTTWNYNPDFPPKPSPTPPHKLSISNEAIFSIGSVNELLTSVAQSCTLTRGCVSHWRLHNDIYSLDKLLEVPTDLSTLVGTLHDQ